MSAILGLFWLIFIWTKVSEFLIYFEQIVPAILGLFYLIFIWTEVSEFLILEATSVCNFRFNLVNIHLDCGIRISDTLSD